MRSIVPINSQTVRFWLQLGQRIRHEYQLAQCSTAVPQKAPDQNDATQNPEKDREESCLKKLRDAIKNLGLTAKPEAIIKEAHVANKLARQLLRKLEELEEYSGFSRPNPKI